MIGIKFCGTLEGAFGRLFARGALGRCRDSGFQLSTMEARLLFRLLI